MEEAAEMMVFFTGDREEDKEDKLVCKTLTESDAINMMDQGISQFSTLTGLKPTICRVLLDHYKWDLPFLTEQYFAVTDDDNNKLTTFFQQAGINGYPFQDIERPIPTQCSICFDEDTPMTTGGNCNHAFCIDCYKGHFNSCLLNNNMANYLRCAGLLDPKPNCTFLPCPAIVDDDVVMNLLKDDPKLITMYVKNIMSSFVNFNKNMSFCPGTDCSKVMKLSEDPPRFQSMDLNTHVSCESCSTSFCFNCKLDPHEMVPCSLMKAWMCKVSNGEEFATSIFIQTKTKDCPKCLVPIEKNGGCNHMVCSKCHHQFCWLCFKEDVNYQHQCTNFVENVLMSKERIEMERLKFILDRYNKNMDSLKFEEKLLEKIREMSSILVRDYNLNWAETTYLDDSFEVLINCRKTLTKGWIFSYITEKNNQKIIFEDNLENLSSQTEKLTGYLEADMSLDGKQVRIFTHKNPATMRDDIVNLTAFCRKRQQVLLDHVKEGMDQECWIFNRRSL